PTRGGTDTRGAPADASPGATTARRSRSVETAASLGGERWVGCPEAVVLVSDGGAATPSRVLLPGALGVSKVGKPGAVERLPEAPEEPATSAGGGAEPPIKVRMAWLAWRSEERRVGKECRC